MYKTKAKVGDNVVVNSLSAIDKNELYKRNGKITGITKLYMILVGRNVIPLKRTDFKLSDKPDTKICLN